MHTVHPNRSTGAQRFRSRSLTTVCLLLLTWLGHAQSVPGFISTAPVPGRPETPGVDNGFVVVPGNAHTPFATNLGLAGTVAPGIPAAYTPNHRVGRTQYLFRANELRAMGMAPGPVTSVAFEFLSPDNGKVWGTFYVRTTAGSNIVETLKPHGLPLGPIGFFHLAALATAGYPNAIVVVIDPLHLQLNSPAQVSALVPMTIYANVIPSDTLTYTSCEVRMGHASPGPLNGDAGGFSGSTWDETVRSAAPNGLIDPLIIFERGPLTIPFSTPFVWNGTDNVVLDVYWLRNNHPGFSPAVRTVTDLPFEATRQALPTAPVGVGVPTLTALVPAFDDNDPCTDCTAAGSVPVPLYMKNTNTRPVVLFGAQRITAITPCLSDTPAQLIGLDPTYTTADAPAQLVGQPAGGFFFGDGMQGDLFDPALAGAGEHSISYTYVDASGCVSTASSCTEVLLNVGAPGGSHQALALNVFPNPGNGRFTLELPVAGEVTLSVLDAQGRLVLRRDLRSERPGTRVPLDLSRMARGAYALVAVTGTTVLKAPVLVE